MHVLRVLAPQRQVCRFPYSTWTCESELKLWLAYAPSSRRTQVAATTSFLPTGRTYTFIHTYIHKVKVHAHIRAHILPHRARWARVGRLEGPLIWHTLVGWLFWWRNVWCDGWGARREMGLGVFTIGFVTGHPSIRASSRLHRCSDAGTHFATGLCILLPCKVCMYTYHHRYLENPILLYSTWLDSPLGF